MISITVKLQI